MRKILCIGSASVDIKAFSSQTDIRNAYREGSIDLVPGGVARCMAMNLRHLGFDTSLYSVVGRDIFGNYLREGLSESGICTELLRTSDVHKTTLFSVMGEYGASASCVYSNAVLSEIVPDRDFYAFVERKGIDTIVTDSNVRLEMLDAIYALKKSIPGLFIFQNATSPDIARKSLPWAKDVDLFAANEFEAAAVLQERPNLDERTARGFRDLGYKNFIVTFGEQGVLVGRGDAMWVEEPYRPKVIADTIGAGDAFAAGFLYGHLGGQPEKKCIRFGLACAKETLATRETVSGILSPEFLENYPHREEEVCHHGKAD